MSSHDPSTRRSKTRTPWLWTKIVIIAAVAAFLAFSVIEPWIGERRSRKRIEMLRQHSWFMMDVRKRVIARHGEQCDLAVFREEFRKEANAAGDSLGADYFVADIEGERYVVGTLRMSADAEPSDTRVCALQPDGSVLWYSYSDPLVQQIIQADQE